MVGVCTERALRCSLRPTTRKECNLHLAGFGLLGDIADQKIRRLSGGQRSRLVRPTPLLLVSASLHRNQECTESVLYSIGFVASDQDGCR